MKALIVILALLVSVLSMMPCCVDGSCSEDEVAATGQSDSHENDTEACSPFYSCAACVGFTVQGSMAEPVTLVLAQSSPIAVYQQPSFPQLHYTIWQPPRII